MSPVAQFLLLAAIEVAGLFAIWFIVKAKVRRYLELENLLAGVREEARALVLEMNETADRNVSLVEDRMVALRELLVEADRRIVLGKKELATRENEREIYAKLNKRRPIVPSESRTVGYDGSVEYDGAVGVDGASEAAADEPITLSLGQAETSSAVPRQQPEVSVRDGSALSAKTMREEALDLYKRGFSADLIAARTGATVAEIELLLEIEERRAAGRGSSL